MAYPNPTPRDPRGTGAGDRWPIYASYVVLAAILIAIIIVLMSRETATVTNTPAEPPAKTETAPPQTTSPPAPTPPPATKP